MSNVDIVRQIVDENINPLLAAHGGRVVVQNLIDGTVYISMEGGCQGCAMAKQTINQFVLKTLMQNIPCITEVVDITNHDAGTDPYFKKDI